MNTTRLSRSDYRRLGPHWRKRIRAALDTLADAEGALLRSQVSMNMSGKLSSVCDGLRAIEDLDGVEPRHS